ncbi:hypothetical protein ES705_48808 [subsurface metagenome]
MTQKIMLLPYTQSLTEKEGRIQLSGRRLIALAVPDPHLLFFTAQQAQTALAEHANVDWTIIGGTAAPGDEIGLLITLNETLDRVQNYRLTVGERMLGVKLKLVDFPACQEINQAIQGLHRRNLIAADVEEHAPR